MNRPGLTLAATTLASSMILVDQTAVPLATPNVLAGLQGDLDLASWILTANVLPLAALMVLGGRLGDMLGLRRVFLAGAVIFATATVLAGAAQDMTMLIAARAVQGTGAALMMPMAVAITSAVYPKERRGWALGILAGASAFFAALGPVLGGLLTGIDWRLVFLINVPLAAAAVVLTLIATPDFKPDRANPPKIDYAGTATFGLGVAALVLALTQGQADGWSAESTIVPLVASVALLVAFVLIELRVDSPLLEFRLFRHVNFLAANISQFLAGMIELGLGFLMPFYLLLVVGVSPEAAGIALIPATIPIVLAGPLAGRAFDRVGGRVPLVAGYLVLAASGAALALAASDQSVGSLIPGLLLQGAGLGVVLTVNDPTGLGAVPEKDRGQAAGTINTSEQLGGAIGIAALTALELGIVRSETSERLINLGTVPTDRQLEAFHEYILRAEQLGREHAPVQSGVVRRIVDDSVLAHVNSFELTFLCASGLALLGALACLLLVRRDDRYVEAPVFSRRSRWVWGWAGLGPGVTRRPPLDEPAPSASPR